MYNEKKQTKKYGVSDVFFLYWFILIVWQNISNITSRSGLDFIVKLGLLLMLILFFHIRSTYINSKNFIAVLLITMCLCITFFQENVYSASVLVSYFFPVFFAYLCYCVGNKFQVSQLEYNRYLNMVIGVVWCMAIYSIIFDYEKFISVFTISNAYGNELSSFLVSNHEYAMYLTFAIAACFIQYISIGNCNTRIKKLFYLFSVFVFGINLILTYSRTAMLSCAIMVIVFICFDKSKLKRWLLGCIILALIIIVSSSALRSYVFEIILKGNTDAGRSELLNIAIDKFMEAPLYNKIFGYGYSFVDAFLNSETSHSSVHNAYVQLLLTNGIAGLIILILAVLNNLIEGVKLIKKDRFFGAIFSGLAFSVICFMLTNTAIIFYSPIDSTMMTIFAIILPKYVRNSIYNNSFRLNQKLGA